MLDNITGKRGIVSVKLSIAEIIPRLMVLCAVVFVIFLRTFVTFWTPDCRLTFERSHRILILVESPLSV